MTVMALTIMVGARAGQVGEKQARQKASAFMTGQATTRGEVIYRCRRRVRYGR